MNLPSLAIAGLLVGAPSGFAQTPPEPAAALHSLTEGFTERLLELDPLAATAVGDRRFDDRLAMDLSEAHRQRVRSLYLETLEDLEEIDPAELDPQDALTAQVLRRDLELGLAGMEFPDHLLAVSSGLGSLPNLFVAMGKGDGLHPFATVEDYDNFLGRMEDFGRWVDLAVKVLGNEVAKPSGKRVVQPCKVVGTTAAQLQAQLVESSQESAFYRPISLVPAGVSGEERRRLAAAYEAGISDWVLPAYRKLHAFIDGPYRAACRAASGLAELPGGEAWYRHLVRLHTTTELTPEEIFKIGDRELERLGREMLQVQAAAGYRDNAPGFFRWLQGTPSHFLVEPRGVVAAYEAVGRRVEAALPKLFREPVPARLEIRALDPTRSVGAPGAFYERPAMDGSRAGVFYVNAGATRRGGAYSKAGVEALYLHEGVPGHHYQISLAQSAEELPLYRRFSSPTAYVEGWALYAETLGDDLGLYRDPLSRWGRLTSEMLRAARLVGDTALHHKGWSRERLERYLQRRAFGLGIGEIERWSVMPGQALAYKIGQLKISELRAEAEKHLGARFDLPAFHRVVLESGALPLDLLESQVRAWYSRDPWPVPPRKSSTRPSSATP